jgi:hypothetical protein
MGWFGPSGICGCCGGDEPLPCEMCGEDGPVTGGTIEFTGMPSSLTSTRVIGADTHVYDITLDLNHSRYITFSTFEGGCCWSAPYADIGTMEFIYERYNGGVRVARFRATTDLRSSVKTDASVIGEPITCSSSGPFVGHKYIIQNDTYNVLEGSFSDPGGGNTWLWPDDCGGIYASGNDDFGPFPFPSRFLREALGWGQTIDPLVNTGEHILTACPFDKTLNCGFGRVIWTPS